MQTHLQLNYYIACVLTPCPLSSFLRPFVLMLVLICRPVYMSLCAIESFLPCPLVPFLQIQ